MRAIVAALALLLLVGVTSAMEVPSDATIIYRGRAEGLRDVVIYRDGTGRHWEGRYSETGVGLVSLRQIPNLNELRPLLRVDDYDGVMGSALWNVDTDGDGFSDMLEYLTNGDPLDARLSPTDPEFLYFDDGSRVVPLLPYADIEAVDDLELASLETVAAELAAIRELHAHGVYALSLYLGLYLWRLVVLAKCQRTVL